MHRALGHVMFAIAIAEDDLATLDHRPFELGEQIRTG